MQEHRLPYSQVRFEGAKRSFESAKRIRGETCCNVYFPRFLVDGQE